MFFTDMESQQADEDAVLAIASSACIAPRSRQANRGRGENERGILTSIVGVGVDLSVGAVQSISSTPGGKYMSVSSANEFARQVKTGFLHDVVPIAFDIRVTLGSLSTTARPSSRGKLPRVMFQQGYGHPEAVAGVTSRGCDSIVLSSEFASVDEADPPIMFKLSGCWKQTNSRKVGDCALTDGISVSFSWRSWDGREEKSTIFTPTPLLAHSSSSSVRGFSCLNIRKALALIKFVDVQEAYMTDDSRDGIEKHEEGVIAAERWVERITACRDDLLAEVSGACGDVTLGTLDSNPESNDENLAATNRAFLDTLQQIIDLETKEALRLKTARADAAKKAEALAMIREANGEGMASCDLKKVPHDFLCPITREVMSEPVVLAGDGFSYEREAIETWLRAKKTSPKTNRVLSSKEVFPNRSLKALILEHADRIRVARTSPQHRPQHRSKKRKCAAKKSSPHSVLTVPDGSMTARASCTRQGRKYSPI